MVERIYASALLHARRCLPDDPALEAEDLVQSAYLKVGDRLDPTRSAGEQVAYLRRAITQVAIDHARRLARRHTAPLPPDLAAPGDLAHEAQVAADLAAALAVPRRGQAERVLHGLGYSGAEIAARLGQGLSTTKNRLYQAQYDAREE